MLSGYRFGYQGSEKDNEIYGEGNAYTTEFRAIDVRLGRWFSVDPETKSRPWESPFVSMSNKPIWHNDPLGDSDDKPNASNKNTSTKIHKEKLKLTQENPAVRQLTFRQINKPKDPVDDNHLDFKISLDIGATAAAKAEVGGIGLGVKLGASMEAFSFSIQEGDYKETTVNTQILDFKNVNPKVSFDAALGQIQGSVESQFSLNGTNKPVPFGFSSPEYKFGSGGITNSYNTPKQETTFLNFSIGVGAVVNLSLKYVSSGHGYPTGKPASTPIDNTRVSIPIVKLPLNLR